MPLVRTGHTRRCGLDRRKPRYSAEIGGRTVFRDGVVLSRGRGRRWDRVRFCCSTVSRMPWKGPRTPQNVLISDNPALSAYLKENFIGKLGAVCGCTCI